MDPARTSAKAWILLVVFLLRGSDVREQSRMYRISIDISRDEGVEVP